MRKEEEGDEGCEVARGRQLRVKGGRAGGDAFGGEEEGWPGRRRRGMGGGRRLQ